MFIGLPIVAWVLCGLHASQMATNKGRGERLWFVIGGS